jgi:hypothetical protein
MSKQLRNLPHVRRPRSFKDCGATKLLGHEYRMTALEHARTHPHTYRRELGCGPDSTGPEWSQRCASVNTMMKIRAPHHVLWCYVHNMRHKGQNLKV